MFVRANLAVEPVLHGGGQEDGRRSGTENVAWAVALATAIDKAVPHGDDRDAEFARISSLIERLISGVLEGCSEARLTGPDVRLPSIASFTFDRLNGETLLLELEQRGIVVSSGSACAAGKY